MDPKDVNFRDYDGTVLYAYTKDEFLALNEFPPLPTQPGLICQEWNWDYEDAVEYVRDCGILEVGATYITDDGKTRLYIYIDTNFEITISILVNLAAYPEVNWGDGSALEEFQGYNTGTISHTYKSGGNYCISLFSKNGTDLRLGANGGTYGGIFGSTYSSLVAAKTLKRIECGENTSFYSYSLYNCINLEAITLSKGVSLSSNMFYNCYGLKHIVFPNNIELQAMLFEMTRFNYIGMGGRNSLSLTSTPKYVSTMIAPKQAPKQATNLFDGTAVSQISIPSGWTSTPYNAFANNTALRKVSLPSTITSIGDYTLRNCSKIEILDFSRATSIPTLSSNGFYGSNSTFKIVVPDNLYDSWIAETNWSAKASQIVKVSEFNG